MRFNQKGFTLVEIMVLIFGSIIGLGWVKNIVKFTKCDFKTPYKAEIIYGVGLLPLVGAVTGWLNVGK